jgi:hypothetical protein
LRLADLVGPATRLLGLVGQELGRNVRNDTTLRDNDVTEELVQLFVVLDRKLKMARNNTSLFVV